MVNHILNKGRKANKLINGILSKKKACDWFSKGKSFSEETREISEKVISNQEGININKEKLLNLNELNNSANQILKIFWNKINQGSKISNEVDKIIFDNFKGKIYQ